MLHLRRCVLTRLLSSPAASPIPLPLRRILSAPRISPNPSFAVEDYLVCTCGLTRAQALNAAPKLSHLKSPTNPDAVLTYLAGLGLSSADIAALVAKDPKFLCTSVERTIAPIFIDLTGLGLSHTEIARLLLVSPSNFRCRSIVSSVPYYIFLFGSYENFLRVLKPCLNLLSSDLEKVVKPNVALLQECGLGASDFAKLCLSLRLILCTKPEHARVIAERVEALGVPHGSRMFKQALHAASLLSKEKITNRMEYLKNTFRWSDAVVGIAVCKLPIILTKSKDNLQRRSEFLISEMGLEPPYIAHRPAMLTYSLEGRLRPRYYVMKFLKANGLLDHDRDYYSTVAYTEKVFVEKFIRPHNEATPRLAEDYVAACKGQLPTRFRFA